jgi:hypothetical protein
MHGLAEKVYDKTYFTHRLEWTFNERGPFPKWVWCPQGPLLRTKAL